MKNTKSLAWENHSENLPTQKLNIGLQYENRR